VAYLTVLAPQGAALDVGCARGRAFSAAALVGATAVYVGIDLSAVAIAARAKDEDARTTFAQADAERYQPAGLFDAIVFNESLYYFHEPLATLRRYMQALRPGGVAIISLYTASPRARVLTAKCGTMRMSSARRPRTRTARRGSVLWWIKSRKRWPHPMPK
jgi:SAM-dependent methyltransferase